MFRDETPAVLRERNEQLLQELEVLRQEAEDLRNNRAAIQNIAPDAATLAAAATAVAAAPAAPAAIHRVAVKLPAFWPDRPSLWFAQADSQFILSDIRVESTKFHYVVSQLDARVALEVEDIITNPPDENPYTFLRLKLIERLSASEEQRVRQLISEEELGDRKPSQFLRHLRSLAGATIVQDNLMRQLWLHRLPSSVRAILATQTDAALDKLAELADKIIEIAPCTPILINFTIRDSYKQVDLTGQTVISSRSGLNTRRDSPFVYKIARLFVNLNLCPNPLPSVPRPLRPLGGGRRVALARPQEGPAEVCRQGHMWPRRRHAAGLRSCYKEKLLYGGSKNKKNIFFRKVKKRFVFFAWCGRACARGGAGTTQKEDPGYVISLRSGKKTPITVRAGSDRITISRSPRRGLTKLAIDGAQHSHDEVRSENHTHKRAPDAGA
ncbi:unnamed protein product [Trichogramma brassicae]|uniref:DUF7041 domain-containing protein n=1 Tax=Trichogramma brassicae TaxID=86971 RepID=A0A6H5IDL7_9HYME|nr:unnamed protein product [Trichogramma brassicae]